MDTTRHSLLLRACEGDEDAWRRLTEVYQPLLQRWLLAASVPPQDADDLTQELMVLLLRRLRQFEPSGRVGSFRAWLRVVTVNRAREFFRSVKRRPGAVGGDEFLRLAEQLEDADSDLSHEWDAQHDSHVLGTLLARLEGEFDASSLEAFRRVVLAERPPAEVAGELGLTRAAVYAAKARVLARLRLIGQGLLD
jgi:RNA polymerase sigma-70 factor (ECF subfamily)